MAGKMSVHFQGCPWLVAGVNEFALPVGEFGNAAFEGVQVSLVLAALRSLLGEHGDQLVGEQDAPVKLGARPVMQHLQFCDRKRPRDEIRARLVALAAFPESDVRFLQHVPDIRAAGHQRDDESPHPALVRRQLADELLELPRIISTGLGGFGCLERIGHLRKLSSEIDVPLQRKIHFLRRSATDILSRCEYIDGMALQFSVRGCLEKCQG